MFKIQFSPQAADQDSVVIADGDLLIVDGEPIDFESLGEGEQCDTLAPLVGPARRVDGVIHVGVTLKYNSATAEPMQSTDPADYVIELSDGKAADVIRRKPIVEVEPMEDAPDVDPIE